MGGKNDSYRVHFSLIGEGIIYSHPSGSANASSTKKSLLVNEKVAQYALENNTAYVQIENFSELTDFTLDARLTYIRYFHNRQGICGLVFFGVSYLTSLSIRIAAKMYLADFPIKVVSSYQEAVGIALSILERQGAGIAPVTKGSEKPLVTEHKGVRSDPSWIIRTDGYTARYEIIDGHILHSSAQGYFGYQEIRPVIEIQEKLFSCLDPDRTDYHMIADISGITGTSYQARSAYKKAQIDFYSRYHFESLIFYGGSKILKAAVYFGRSFLPFKMILADNLEDSLSLVQENKSVPDLAKTGKRAGVSDSHKTTEEYVSDVLTYLGTLNLNVEAHSGERVRFPENHPFQPVFDTIDLINDDLNELAKRQKAEEKKKLIAQKVADDQEKHALVGRIAGKMAHDFNNILGIIMGNTELSLLDCSHEKTRTTLNLILEQSIRGKNLLKNLVAFAKDQEPKQEFFRIHEKIELVLNLMRKDLEGIELVKEEHPGVPELLADPGMIEHALVNLIQNAIHALSLADNPRITIRTYCSDDRIKFEIEDNGCGIPKEYLERIYEPSFTLKGGRDLTGSYKSGIKGTGYGMSNVKKYIEQHRGNISIDSQPGSGTRVTVSLPVVNKELSREEIADIGAENVPVEKHILLVEDEAAIADVQYSILTQAPCHHTVDVAGEGKKALELLAENTYDLVSLDYVLADDISGMEIYHYIRSRNRTVPVLFISGNIEFLQSIKSLKQNDTNMDHLSKPCQNKVYIDHVSSLLNHSSAQNKE